MSITKEQLRPIKKEFQEIYMHTEPYKKYTNGCGISKIKVKQNDLDLKEGESLDDLCLSVFLREEPPKSLDLPSEYKGVRVFYEVVGEIRAL